MIAQKGLNRSTWQFGWRLGLAKGTMYYMGGGANPPTQRGNFRGLSRSFKSIGYLRCSYSSLFSAKGIIQSPITSCSRMDHSICEASANRNPENPRRKECGLSVRKVVMGVHSVGDVWYLRLPYSMWLLRLSSPLCRDLMLGLVLPVDLRLIHSHTTVKQPVSR